MALYSISENKKIFILDDGNQISFKDKIETVLVFPNVWVVHLGYSDAHMGKQPNNNIFGIDSECNILWNIKQITGSYLGNLADDYYNPPRKLSGNVFRTTNFNCYCFDIDVDTLEVVHRAFVK